MTDRCILINALAKEGWLLIDSVHSQLGHNPFPVLLEEWLKDGQVLEARFHCGQGERNLGIFYCAHYSSIGSGARVVWNGNDLPFILKAIRGDK